MIELNNKEVAITRFPDNTVKFDLESGSTQKTNEITWKFESMEELFILIGLLDKLKSTEVNLFMPYMPNARMDKIQDENEGLMLKYFVKTLDNLGFNRITILDPHSDAYKQWVKNTEWIQDDKFVKKLITCATNIIKMTEKNDKTTLVYPDKGARNRYTSLLGANENLYGVKERDQATGNILSFDLVGNVPNNPILIVDDISSKGGTFYFTAKKLREKGFTGSIYLYITHAEETIEQGELLKPESEIKRVFTTNSILNKDIAKTTIFTL